MLCILIAANPPTPTPTPTPRDGEDRGSRDEVPRVGPMKKGVIRTDLKRLFKEQEEARKQTAIEKKGNVVACN